VWLKAIECLFCKREAQSSIPSAVGSTSSVDHTILDQALIKECLDCPYPHPLPAFPYNLADTHAKMCFHVSVFKLRTLKWFPSQKEPTNPGAPALTCIYFFFLFSLSSALQVVHFSWMSSLPKPPPLIMTPLYNVVDAHSTDDLWSIWSSTISIKLSWKRFNNVQPSEHSHGTCLCLVFTWHGPAWLFVFL
jgi:hypothetical protein